MAKHYSPLANVLKSGRFGADTTGDNIAAAVSEVALRGVLQIAGWADFETHAQSILDGFGFVVPENYAQSLVVQSKRLLRIAPDRMLILSADPLPNIPLASDTLALLDLSHSRTAISVGGPSAEQIMARLAGIDFRLSAFPVDHFAQTGMHHVGVLIYRPAAESFHIVVPVTWAQSLWEMICLTAAPFGYTTAMLQSADHVESADLFR